MSAVISFPRYVRIGAGAIRELADVLEGLKLGRPLLVTDAYLTATGAAERVLNLLSQAGMSVALFDRTVPDPTTASLEDGLEAVRAHGADCVIGFGGGSPMDSAKALAVLAHQGGPMRKFKAPSNYAGPALPVVAIPTTAGSGSEATQFTVISDSETNEKMLCPGLSFLPVAAIVDFELTMSMPPRLTADTGVDALTHAVEAYVSRKANPISDTFALSAIRLIAGNIKRAYRDGSDPGAREAMMVAATQAGMAFSNSSVALVHGMSRPIGAHFHVAHGLSNAMLFPAVTEFSVDGAEGRYADCARAYGTVDIQASDSVAARALVEALAQLCSELEVPTPRSYGIDRQAWDSLTPLMAQQALASGSPANNPVVPTAEQIEAIYARVYG
ncbi:alcohol dehydrogenase [Mycobacterium intermedium]|uniref:Alcohol dehydrogenase n=1 Tax=Mycobacterium intermedium TaxID=28445 RepID=A0A1E3SIM9_MYCIE|nr:iron-containing alcohol dehydrogenase [Mycobacterium intermedium]MCV6967179.1 iron-containing alcohol dehydrogenase [Mycobacterium intermedium]ODR02007.1 alcohol dehydrogenase [Mycobacterium intermedium]OPE51288.1 alcohol dehydrogenase [Mycobacterium intermedium]ORB05783.1 alcohol dehydrogenase [Mycobacterium intermedium]